MRLYDEILRRAKELNTPTLQKMRDDMQGATVVACDNVTEYFYVLNDKENWTFPKDFPNCTPPFKNCFIETMHPSKMVSDTYGTRDWDGADRWGFHVKVYDWTDPQFANFKTHMEAHWQKGELGKDRIATTLGTHLIDRTRWFVEILNFFVFADQNWRGERTEPYIGSAGKAYMFISEDGEAWQFDANYEGEAWAWEPIPGETDNLELRLKQVADALSEAGLMDPRQQPPPGASHAREFFRVMFAPCLLALNFANCKNVVLVDEEPPRQQRRAAEREGRPLTVFKTLQIGPMAQMLRTRPGSKGLSGIKLRLHLRRGGLRDYRKGRGLFGKYHGLWWWEDHVVGDPDKGVVEKDYEINPPATV